MLFVLVCLAVQLLDLGVVLVLDGVYFLEASDDFLLLIEFVAFHHLETFDIVYDFQVFSLFFQFFDVLLPLLVDFPNLLLDRINLVVELLVSRPWQHISFEGHLWDFSLKGNLNRFLIKLPPWSPFTASSSSAVSIAFSIFSIFPFAFFAIFLTAFTTSY